jgi:hypothetical protein
MRTSEAVDQIYTALAAAQGQTDAAMKEKTNPAFKSKYADLASHVEVIRPAAAACKLAVLQDVTSDDASVYVTTRLAHASGQWIEFGPLGIPANKHDAQGFGSATSYARRYALSAAWGTVADDDDGNAASKSAPKKDADPVKTPAGYDAWQLDLMATADEGTPALQSMWKASKPEYRSYLTSTDNDHWGSIKAKAARVTTAAAPVRVPA